MNWKNLLSSTTDFRPDEARVFMESRKTGDYQLIDVRQPKEYEAGHLAGAMLIPLKDLPDRLVGLDKNKPVLVYCAIGGRSKAAAQFLAGRDFREVYNLAGGIKAWSGHQALGDQETGVGLFFPEDGEHADAVSLAYAMEDGLEKLYLTLASRAGHEAVGRLYLKLAGFEELHKKRLLARYLKSRGPDAQAGLAPGGLIEGGGQGEDLLARFTASAGDGQDILDLAMGLETQALDLYDRLAKKSEDQELKEFFGGMADEERTHLAFLSAAVDEGL